MFCKKLDHMINKGSMEALCQRKTNMDAHKKLLESARRGMQMMRYLRHKARHPIAVECTAQFANQRSVFPIRRIMQMRTKNFLSVTLVFLVIVLAGSLYAQERGTHPSMVPEAASGTSAYVEAFGVPLAPAIYLANFMIFYFVNPEVAANMPAYRAALPQEVYECLVENPDGCPYAKMEQYFAEQALETGGIRNSNTLWPSSCQIDPKWQNLAPPEYQQPYLINQPLGREKADQLARLLGMDEDMILTDQQYNCMMGISPRSNKYGRDIIRVCLDDLTNSIGNAAIPLSSYGLSLDKKGYVRSNCAPKAPCLEFNQLAINGSLDAIARECNFGEKLQRLIDPRYTETPFPEILLEGVACQGDWVPSCIVETASPGNGG